MFDIHDENAASHVPEALKTNVLPARPENLFALLAGAFENDTGFEVKLREGEIFIARAAR